LPTTLSSENDDDGPSTAQFFATASFSITADTTLFTKPSSKSTAAHGEFPTDIRRSFEWSLLWNMAIEIGLYNCSLDAQGSQPTLGPSAFQVVAIGSQTDDMLDTEPAGKIHSHLLSLVYTGSF
jgi:hypothetical protein